MATSITDLLSPILSSAMPALRPQVEAMTDVAYDRFHARFEVDARKYLWQAAIVGACVAAVVAVGFIGYREYREYRRRD